MDTEATKAPVAAAAGKVNPILKKDRDTHHQGGSPERAPAAAAAPSSSTAGEGAGGKQAEPESPGKEKKHLTWDEHAIEEHDLLRGTRMKIDEPNTPYTHYDHQHSDEESNASGHHPRSPDENHPEHAGATLATQWGDLSGRLEAVAAKRDACPHSPAPSRDSNISDSEDEARKKKEHEKKFKEHRKKHYNEAEMMRRWRAQHANDDDDEEEEDDEEDGKNNKMEE